MSSAMQLIQILLPLPSGRRTEVSADLERVRTTLTEKFGGMTFYRNAPAEGLWKDDGETERDAIVVAEVMVDAVDEIWWRGYRRELERRFKQDEIIVRVLAMRRL
jgi:hypothetical protein